MVVDLPPDQPAGPSGPTKPIETKNSPLMRSAVMIFAIAAVLIVAFLVLAAVLD